ncbi:MAG: TIGR02281 family clan AA aspartic protease [Candidatus Nitrohelix vancouverensis]|uniref:TIGR02281 family clan AA aspartic protease n=1 Tax=Candidatus Nitrohelix vancouverensis TaxID=2705534 RepID=A0A7T0C1U2_9BACT|nr:MAG: TIGR02281 family clan AA aspartic protease [Candidatus Nitrohelix vancouverensis]
MRNCFVVGLVTLGLLFGLERAEADLYSWKDEDGRLHVTDNPSTIPQKYRRQTDGFKTFESRPAPSYPEKENDIPSASAMEIDLIPLPGGHFIATVELNRRVSAKLMLDTGASMITLSKRVADQLSLGLYSAPRISFSTAGGEVAMPLVALDRVQIGGAQAFNVEAAVNPNEMGEVDGLLGMSFLSHFKMELDQVNAKLILKPLAEKGETSYEGKPGSWWSRQFGHLAGRVQGAKARATGLRAQGGVEAANALRLEKHYQMLYQKLKERAFRVGLPERYRR